MDILNNVACIIRTWSNNRDIAKAVKRALGTGIGHVIVIVKDDEPTHYGSVESWLAGLIAAHPGHVTVLPMRVGYSWSNALNYGFDEVRRLNLMAAVKGAPSIDYVLNVSCETLYFVEQIDAMIKEMATHADVGAVGTSFLGRQNGNAIDLGKSYIHPRNTMMLVRWSAFVAIGGYSPRCDQLGGQEDLDWLIRLEQSGRRWSMLDLKVDLLVGMHFDQASKEVREMKAITSIMGMNADIVGGFAKAIQRLY